MWNERVHEDPSSAAERLDRLPPYQFLEVSARHTTNSLLAMIHPQTGLIADRADVRGNPSKYTSNTNIGLELMGIKAAAAWEYISPAFAEHVTLKILETLQSVPKLRGFVPNWLSTDGSVLDKWPSSARSPAYTS